MTIPNVQSRLEIINLKTRTKRLVLADNSHLEAPNWSPDGTFLIVNRAGLLYRVPLQDAQLQLIDTDFATRCNNDHGISPDGKEIVLCSHDPVIPRSSRIYRMPIEGGTPQCVTEAYPSYWHGWSPDGQYLTYVAGRATHSDLKIYRLALATGVEEQLTFGPGQDDGPDYSACGQFIYFNGFRQNKMQIWRIDANGDNPQQLIHSPHSDWFPHPSPDGRHVIFIRYLKDQGEAHPFGQDVQIMLHDLASGETSPITEVFFGGQGSLNVPSWSPNSEEFAFVSYELLT